MRKSGDDADPLTINIFKIALGALLFLPTIWIAGEDWSQIEMTGDFWLLVLSGTIGIGIADTLWLTALSRTNASTVAIVDCAYSPSVVLLSAFILGERLSANQIFGCALVLCSLLFVAIGSKSKKNPPDIADNIFPLMIEGIPDDPRLLRRSVKTSPRDLRIGIASGISAVVLMALGVVIMKPILSRYPLFITIEIRTVAGLIFLFFLIPFRKGKQGVFASLSNVRNKTLLVVGSLLASYISMIFWVAGTKYTTASIASVLNQTSTLFIIIFAFFILKEPLGRSKIIASVIGLAGVFLVLGIL